MRAFVMALLVLTGAAVPVVQWISTHPSVDARRQPLAAFIVRLDFVTRPGERVALVVPPEYRDQDTIIYRARYLLPDRYFVTDTRNADVIAYWRVTPPPLPGRRMRRLPEGLVFR